MPFDVFGLRDTVVGEYAGYFESFVHIDDPQINSFVCSSLRQGQPWPDAVLQLNPAYEPGPTLRELVESGAILPQTAHFFGQDLRLHRHQEEALDAAQRGEPYIVTTGTGSGKSLTYLLPIVDFVFRHDPEDHGVRAIIVYPMNALINSQLDALHHFRESNWPAGCPLRFARYTGQEGSQDRDAILQDPPHILLTNYVMLEYLLIRPHERPLVQRATRHLQFLVMDEMHVYRGRQGADVAMLMRRVRERASQAGRSSPLQFVGTSATMASEGSRQERSARVAEVGSTLFGVAVLPDNVIGETLRRVAAVPAPRTPAELCAAVEAASPDGSYHSLVGHPLTAWLEETFGLGEEEGRLVRRTPIPFSRGVDLLAKGTGLDWGFCEERLRAILACGYAVAESADGESGPGDDPALAFRLHQWLASGSSVFATIQPPEERYLTTEGQLVAPGGDERRLLFPLAFCRECGQEYYLVSRVEEGGEQRLIARSPLLNAAEEMAPGTGGFFAPQRDELWSREEDLPEFWLEELRSGTRVKRQYRDHEPQPVRVRPDGTLAAPDGEDGAVDGWFQPRPLMLCLRCRTAYDRRNRSDFAKLATLSQTGRSTATTITTGATVTALRRQPIDPDARKMLSFTDNRQDASLQAGHLNDFVQVALLRGALARAVQEAGPFRSDALGLAAFNALQLDPAQYMRQPVDSGPGYVSARSAMIDLLQYRAFEDLRRAWRVAQPNLEQCGLLGITYAGLSELASDDARWSGAPGISEVSAERRERVLRAILDHLRSSLALDTECLDEDRTRQLVNRVNQWLRDPWAVDENERLRTSAIALLPGSKAGPDEWGTIGLGWRSSVGRYLRSRRTWDSEQDLSPEDADALVGSIVDQLRGHILSVVSRGGTDWGVQIMAGALVWECGTGQAAGPDIVRSRSLHLRRQGALRVEPNHYFERLYRDRSSDLKDVRGREHTGQTPVDQRIEREEEFRHGRLAALYCSPTMELGVDIADLAVVHMRNVPPTPANYAQRSGRAGRGGRPALVLTFCSQGSAHDEHFFRHKDRMIAGAVAPARIDLANEDLVRAHLHSVWLAAVGVSLGHSMADLIDAESLGLPLFEEIVAQLQISEERQRHVIEAFAEVVGGGDSPITRAEWFTDEWLEETVREAPIAFGRAFDRWRELYRAAIDQLETAQRLVRRPRATREERKQAEQQEREANRELTLLWNQGEAATESDFYPYRYLAVEGFLPGYNFPRLPLRALVSSRHSTQSIDRARFLGLSEFGPQNIIYHEGRKHRVTSCVVPAGGLESRLTSAKLCRVCGYIHPGLQANEVDICVGCGTELDGATMDFPQKLFEQPTVRTTRSARITSDEEERAREGYQLTTHYRFAPDRSIAHVEACDGDESLLDIQYAPHAELWRINHGWRRSRDGRGFTIDLDTGKWRKREDDETASGEEPDPMLRKPVSGIMPYVTDHRNILLVRPQEITGRADLFLTTLAYALQRGIQFVYQVEEQEVQVELIGEGEQQRLLLWEAAEGGTGVWERMLNDPHSLAAVAREALRVCHFDPDTGDPDPAWQERCALACYDCLLSYSNQSVHRLIDRHLVRGLLLRLARCEIAIPEPPKGRTAQYQDLLELVDPASTLEREFLTYLYEHGLRLPDEAQTQPEPEVAVQPDFYYARDGLRGACIFVDGPVHSGPERAERDRAAREELEDRGYLVIAVRPGTFEEVVGRYPQVFGTPVERLPEPAGPKRGYVFISHAEEDREVAHALAAGLEAAGLRVWHYIRDTVPGPHYTLQILDAIKRADAVIPVLSRSSLASHQIDMEIVQTHDSAKPFVPLLLGITYDDVKSARPNWAMLMITATAFPILPNGVEPLVPKIVEGLRLLREMPGTVQVEA